MASSRDTSETVNGKKHGYWITYYAIGVKGTTFTVKRASVAALSLNNDTRRRTEAL